MDVADAIAGARYCARMGWVDAERMAIRGNSAGGYTVLRALSHPRSPFRAGASHYGISDLSRLNAETHKFESHYLSWLVGDEQKAPHRYHSRSPIYQPERLFRPVIFFQGEQDRVVPPSQTRALYDNLRDRGIATEYHGFEEERHGFRQAQTRERVLAAECRFYEKHLGIGAGTPGVVR